MNEQYYARRNYPGYKFGDVDKWSQQFLMCFDDTNFFFKLTLDFKDSFQVQRTVQNGSTFGSLYL